MYMKLLNTLSSLIVAQTKCLIVATISFSLLISTRYLKDRTLVHRQVMHTSLTSLIGNCSYRILLGCLLCRDLPLQDLLGLPTSPVFVGPTGENLKPFRLDI